MECIFLVDKCCFDLYGLPRPHRKGISQGTKKEEGRMEPISKYLEDVAKTQVEYLKQPEERDVMEEKRNLFIALSKKKERIN